tara:strand:+ start:8661 stop:9467 length:807 start_codon:yes stop_codon:yes gene_type:complete
VPQCVCNGIQIFFDDTGVSAGKPTIIFIHAHGLDGTMWDNFKIPYREKFRIVTYDLRGHGHSEKPKTSYGRESEVTDLDDLIQFLGVKEVHLIGLSRGASIALSYAALFPEKVDSVVAIGAGFDYSDNVPDFAEQLSETISILKTKGLYAAREHWSQLPIFSTLRNEGNEEALEIFEDTLIGYTGNHWLDPDPPKDSSLLELVAKIKSSVMILVGENDLPGFISCSEQLSEKIEGSVFKKIPELGHLAPIENSEVVSEVIQNFLSESN